MANSLIPPKKHIVEKKEFLRHEEIKTMQKRIAELLEAEARKEREKIMEMGREGEKPEMKKESEKPEEKKFDIILERARELDEQKRMAEELERKRIEIQKSKIQDEQSLPQREKTPEFSPVLQKRPEKEFIKEKTTQIDEGAGENFAEIEKNLENLKLRKQALNEKKNQLLRELEDQKSALVPLVEKEKSIEAKKIAAEEKEKNAVQSEKRSLIENERREIEKERREVEMARWSLEEKIENLTGDLKDIDIQRTSLEEEESKFVEKKNNLLLEAKKIELNEERKRLEQDLQEIEGGKARLEEEKEGLMAKKAGLMEELLTISNNERVIEENIIKIEEKEKAASDPAEKRAIEQERWKAEEEREGFEKERGQKEGEKISLQGRTRKAESDIRDLLEKESKIHERIKKINSEIGQPKEPEKIQIPATPVFQKEEKEEYVLEKEEKTAPAQDEGPEKEIKEKIERIISERGKLSDVAPEIKGIKQKDQAEKTQEPEENKRIEETKRRLSEIQKKEESERRAFLERLKKAEAPQESAQTRVDIPQQEIKTFSKKPSRLAKLWTRLVISVAILAVVSFLIAFWYWFFIIQRR